MRDGNGRLRGFRFRGWDGGKSTLKGTHEGIFLPTTLRPVERIFIAEGPSDTAALLDLGANAVGRPSCTGGVAFIERLVRRMRPSCVVIAADADGPGQQGAETLARKLLPLATVRIITPPAKDVREWLVAGGANPDALIQLIEAAPIRRLRVVVTSGTSGARS